MVVTTLGNTTKNMFALVYSMLVTVSGSDLECNQGYYFDTVTGRCDPCSNICTFTRVQSTQTSCQQHCPGWSEKQITPTQPPSVTSTSSITTTTTAAHRNKQTNESQTINTILLCVGVTIAIISIGICVFGPRLRNACRNVRRKNECNRRGVQPQGDIQETPGLLDAQTEPSAPPMVDDEAV